MFRCQKYTLNGSHEILAFVSLKRFRFFLQINSMQMKHSILQPNPVTEQKLKNWHYFRSIVAVDAKISIKSAGNVIFSTRKWLKASIFLRDFPCLIFAPVTQPRNLAKPQNQVVNKFIQSCATTRQLIPSNPVESALHSKKESLICHNPLPNSVFPPFSPTKTNRSRPPVDTAQSISRLFSHLH